MFVKPGRQYTVQGNVGQFAQRGDDDLALEKRAPQLMVKFRHLKLRNEQDKKRISPRQINPEIQAGADAAGQGWVSGACESQDTWACLSRLWAIKFLLALQANSTAQATSL